MNTIRGDSFLHTASTEAMCPGPALTPIRTLDETVIDRGALVSNQHWRSFAIGSALTHRQASPVSPGERSDHGAWWCRTQPAGSSRSQTPPAQLRRRNVGGTDMTRYHAGVPRRTGEIKSRQVRADANTRSQRQFSASHPPQRSMQYISRAPSSNSCSSYTSISV